MKILKLAIILLFISLYNQAYSCTCIKPENYKFEYAVGGTDVIITGKVIRLDTVIFDSAYDYFDENIIIVVDNVLKTDYDSTIIVGDTISITNGFGNCAFSFKVDETYLIFSDVNHYLQRPWIKNELGTDKCTETTILKRKGLKKLRKAKKHLRKQKAQE